VDARITRISIAPVKALGLVHPEEVELGPDGVAGDRRFWLLDAQGALYNGKRNGALHQIRPSWDEASRRLSLAFPNGEVVEGTVELGEPVAAVMYGEPQPSHRVIGPWQEAISSHAGEDVTLLWSDGGAADRLLGGGSVSLISTASLERLGDQAGVGEPVDGRRFRMLFEVEGLDQHEEDGWIGADIRVGEATVRFNGDVGRCVVTSRHPETGEIDLPTLAVLAAYRPDGVSEPLPFGIYGSVTTPGRVRVGDSATPS
jgi:uncharacterized protein YcbX